MQQASEDVLREYSSGRMGWRDAASRLGVFSFDELEAMRKEAGIKRYVVSTQDESKIIKRLHADFVQSFRKGSMSG